MGWQGAAWGRRTLPPATPSLSPPVARSSIFLAIRPGLGHPALGVRCPGGAGFGGILRLIMNEPN